ncbi:MAG: AAA family ATPase [Desulfobacterales bacterium]|nr:AAA family ATPase [Desulfobacterales bacterium]
MSRYININNLPAGPFRDEELIEICYANILNRIEEAINMRQSILIECDKELNIVFYMALRERRKRLGKLGEFIDSNNPAGNKEGSGSGGPVAALFSKLEKILTNNDVSDKVIILQHLDLMALGSDNILDRMSRDMSFLLHWNPNAVFLGFKDTEIPLPDIIKRFFTMTISIFGIERNNLYKIITKEEAKRFGTEEIDIYKLYKHTSGLNVLQIRKLMQRIERCPLFPTGEKEVLRELRDRTLAASYVHLPDITFNNIGGCSKVIEQIKHDIIRFVDMLTNERSMEHTKSIEKIIPRNILFEGPPGTGKTLLAKALANRINAAVIVVNGPEFVDKYVGESERKLREIFSRARKSAPSVIIFDEIDSIGRKRGDNDDENSINHDTIVNQLLTEMSGFRSDELLFVIGTTNHVSVLDPALLSRIQKIFNIPYPNEEERRQIFKIYNKNKSLDLSDDQIEFLVRKTEVWINPNTWRKFGGREIESLCSSIDRETFGIKRIPINYAKLNKLVEDQIEVHVPKVTFEDIGGYGDVKKQLDENILGMIKIAKKNRNNPELFKIIKKSIPKGVLFYGPPGTGKTMFARALSASLNASIVVISGPEIKTQWYGESERQIRSIFDNARKNSPSVIVFDEFDSIAGERNSEDVSTERSIVNQILTEMDGIKENDLVFVIATTNFPSMIDDAMKRPGRFEFQIEIGYPDEETRREIFKKYNVKYHLDLKEDDIKYLVFRTEMVVNVFTGHRFTGDHIEAICRSIMREKYRNKDFKIDSKLLESVVRGRTNQSEIANEEEKSIIAIHESGHAIVGKYHPKGNPPRRISIGSELAGSLGYVWHKEPKNRFMLTGNDLKGQICQLLGGRAAELLIHGEHSIGCEKDLMEAARIANAMVTELGMDDRVGPRCLSELKLEIGTRMGSFSQKTIVHPDLLKLVDEGINRILTECQHNTEEILKEHKDELIKLKEQLLKEETINF